MPGKDVTRAGTVPPSAPSPRVSSPTIDEIVVGDEPGAWAEAGFQVEGDLVRVGSVRIRVAGRDEGKRICRWTIRDLSPAGTEDCSGPGGAIDGLPTGVSSRASSTPSIHPNTAIVLDHIVLLTPDHPRTVLALERAGFVARRTREAGTDRAPTLQTFFRAGEVIIELVGAGVQPAGGGPARFFGLAFGVEDLDRTKALLGDGVGPIKDAVQPGRRIATLRKDSFDISVDIAMIST